MKYLTVLSAISISLALLTACNQTSNNTTIVKDSVSSDSTKVNLVTMKDDQINSTYKSYTDLKNALVSANVKNAQKASLLLSETLTNIKGCGNTALIAMEISNSTDIKEQRKSFIPLSSDLIALMKNAEVEKGELYVQYCPMANSGKGAFWMASTKAINNPYYGEEMLNCGETKETITTTK